MIISRPLRVLFHNDHEVPLAGVETLLQEYDRMSPMGQGKHEYVYSGLFNVNIPLNSTSFFETLRTTIDSADQYVVQFSEIFNVLYGCTFDIYCDVLDSFYVMYNNEEKQFFEKLGKPGNAIRLEVLKYLDPETSLPILRQRREGVKLLSSAINARSSGAQLTGFVRLFEAAFNLKHSRLERPLQIFLDSGPIKFDTKFAKRVIYLRHRLSHANINTEPSFDPDARPLVPQARQAAYDVLINKRAWSKGDTGRSAKNSLSCYSPDGKNLAGSLGVQIIAQAGSSEYFGRFPTRPGSFEICGTFDCRSLAHAVQDRDEICGFYGINGCSTL